MTPIPSIADIPIWYAAVIPGALVAWFVASVVRRRKRMRGYGTRQ